MQDVEGWPGKGPVRTPGMGVTAGGRAREVVAASMTASVRGSDVSARTGDVEWAPLDPVSRRQETVLTAGAPRRGDRVSIDVGEGSALARVFTGKVDRTASAVPGVLRSELMDDFDLLSEEVDIPSLMATMPPATDEEPPIRVGLTASWPTKSALSQAGFYATPPPRTGAYMSASMNGSLWPEFGTIRTSATLPTWTPVPWGQAASGFVARYTGVAGTMADHPLEVSLLVAPGTASGSTYVYVRFSSGSIRVAADSSRSVRAQLLSGGTTTVLSLSGTEMEGRELARLRVSADGTWELSNDDVSKAATAAVPAVMQEPPRDVYVDSRTGARPIGGLNVGYYTTTPRAWVRTVEMDPPDGTLAASRAVVATPARTVLQERAAAEGARMWIDARGVFRWRSRSRWGAGSPALTLSDVDLLGYTLGMDYDSTYSGVTVTCKVPRTEVRGLATITLYQASRDALAAGDVRRLFIEPPADEDWPRIDNSLDTLGLDGDVAGFNRGRRSWQGALRVSEGGTTEKWAYGAQGQYVSHTFEPITLKKWLHVTTVAANLPAGETVETRSVDRDVVASSGVWRSWGNFNLPVIRGYARVLWVEEKRYGALATTLALPRLEHDCSWWVQGLAVQRLADDLATRCASPIVTITGLSIVPDARIEVGDVLTLTDSTFAGLTARVVVAGVSLTVSDGDVAMSIDVDVLSTSATAGTYADIQATASAATYAQFQALIGAVTYQEQEAS